MAFQYKNLCFSDYNSAIKTVVSDCPPVASDGSAISCSVISGGLNVTKTLGKIVTSTSVPFVFNDCTFDMPQVVDLNAALLLLLVTAFCIQMLKRIVR